MELTIPRTAPHRSFLRSLFSLAGGTAIGQGLMVAAAPIITRVYSPAEMGAFSVFVTVTGVLNAVNSLRYEMGIPVAEDESTANSLLFLCAGLVTAFCGILAAVLWFWGGSLCQLLKVPSLTPLLWLLPLAVGVAGYTEALSFFSTRKQAFAALAQSRILQGSSHALLQILLAFAGAGALGLVAGDIGSRVLGGFRLVWTLKLRKRLTDARWKKVLETARRFSRYPKYMGGASFLNLVALQIPFILIPSHFGPEAAGHYFLAYRTLFLPASFIGDAISQIFLGEAAERVRQGAPLAPLTMRIVIVLAAIYTPLYAVCLGGAGRLFPVIFGGRWGAAGEYAQLLAPMILLWSLARPISILLIVRDRLKESLAFTCLQMVGVCTAIYLGGRTGSMHKTAAFISIYGVLFSMLSIVRFLRAAEVDMAVAFRRLAILLSLSAPLVIAIRVGSSRLGTFGLMNTTLLGVLIVSALSLGFLRREGLL